MPSWDAPALSVKWIIIDKRLSRLPGDRIFRSLYQFHWTTYKNSRGTGKPGPTRYVEVELAGFILSLRGAPADVLELAKRADLFILLPRNSCCLGARLDQKKLAEFNLVQELDHVEV